MLRGSTFGFAERKTHAKVHVIQYRYQRNEKKYIKIR